MNSAAQFFNNHSHSHTQQDIKLSGKIVSEAVEAASSLFSIPKDMAVKIQAAKLRLPITEIRSFMCLVNSNSYTSLLIMASH